MGSELTTNDVRRTLEDLGAVNPSKKAVEVVAEMVCQHGETRFWEMRKIPPYVIKQAVKACEGAKREESNRIFKEHCLRG